MGNIITIIGAAGKMGKWFFDYFNCIRQEDRHNLKKINNINLIVETIVLYDIKKIDYFMEKQNKNIVISSDISHSIRNSDIVIFCIPANEIIDLVNSNAKFFKKNAIVIEISSVKSKTYKILSELSLKIDIIPLCIHPMFGPGASISSINKIIFVPVNKQRSKIEENALDNIFPHFEKITIEDPHKHDLAISVIISLIYFINIVFSKFLIDLSNIEDFKFDQNILHFFKKISGSSFKIQSLLSESILTDDPSLFLTLFVDNDTTVPIVQKYRLLFNQLLGGIEKKDKKFIKEFVQITKSNITGEGVDINNSYDMIYKFLNSHK